MKHNIYEFSLFFEDFVFRIQRILKYPSIQMFADWSCIVLVHNRTCCRKYHISQVIIYLCYKHRASLYVNIYFKRSKCVINRIKKENLQNCLDGLQDYKNIMRQLNRIYSFQDTFNTCLLNNLYNVLFLIFQDWKNRNRYC